MQICQAKVQTLNTVKFALGWCGNNEIAKALTLIASGAGESFCLLFAEKSKSHCTARVQKRLCSGLPTQIINRTYYDTEH